MTPDAATGRGKAAEKRLQRRKARERFIGARKAERQFAKNLKGVAKQVGHIVNGLAPKGIVKNLPELKNALERYSQLLHPWAKSVAAAMLAEVDQRDGKAWTEMGREVGRELRKEILNAPTGQVMRELMHEQVSLITSLPTKAAERVQALVIEGMSDGRRAKAIAEEIQQTGRVTESRAMLIARTETSKSVTAMTQARAQFVGSEQYIWRTVKDSDVREVHRHLEGQVCRWDDPPVAEENGDRHHPGAFPNCRCWAEPILPDVV